MTLGVPTFNWTDAAIAALTDLCQRQMSARQIADALSKQFDSPLSRSAVMGKLKRDSIPWDHKGTGFRAKGPKKEKLPRTSRTSAVWSLPEELCDLPPDESPCAVAFMQLEPHHCRWPLARLDNQAMFCGADSLSNFPYCARHCRMAYSKPRELSDCRRDALRHRALKLNETKTAVLQLYSNLDDAA